MRAWAPPERTRSITSASRFVPTTAATIEPAEVPETILGSSFSSSSAETTPRCLTPIAPPPERRRAVRPKAWRVSLMNASRCAGCSSDASERAPPT